MMGKVYLLGAGPGDPGLITSRALRRLGEAEVVLYDSLVHPDLLAHCRPDADLVFVGKRAGQASERQGRINERLVAEARAGRSVARLKGGDPYLFGRGSEEAAHLKAQGVPFEVVPGVPSPLVAAAYAGVSLTHRELASSVAYVTATESPEKDRSSHDWDKLATATETLVIFMGLRKLATLMQILADHGRAPETPVCVVQNASLPSQRTVVGTVDTIADLARAAGIGAPALTIVGPVVALRDELRWFDEMPLFGKRVLVTRPSGQAAVLTARLRDEGAAAEVAPTIVIADPEDPGPLAAAARDVGEYDWVLFTSRNGVERFFAEIRRQGGDARRLGRGQVVAIGPGTSQALYDFGITPDHVPSEYRGEEVARIVADAHGGDLRGVKVLFPRAAVAREILPETLREAGAEVDVVPVYRNLAPDAAESARIAALVRGRHVDVVTFTASSTVENLCALLDASDGPGAVEALAPLTVASIGPITTRTALRLGLRVHVTATEYTNDGLVDALRAYFASK